jgi:phage terminase large subunit
MSEVRQLELSDEQSKAFHRLTSPKHENVVRVVYGGQAGGGKSYLISLWLDYMCQTYPGTRYYMARETLKQVKESVLLSYFEVIKTTGSNIKYNEQKSKISYPNGSEIYFIEFFAYPSDPNFDSFGSREFTAGAIEEGITCTKRAANILLSRTRFKHDVYNLTPKQLITCNPGDGWIKDEIVIPFLETGQALNPNNVFINATLSSNPNKKFVEIYTKNLEENQDTFEKERLLHGNWDAKPKSGCEYLKEFNQDIHVKRLMSINDELPGYDPFKPLHITFDENVNPHITCLIFQIHNILDKKVIRQIAEVCPKAPNNTRKYVCSQIQKLFPLPKHVGGMFIYGDASSQKQETDKEAGENFFTDIMTYLKPYNPRKRVPGKNPPVVSKGGFLNLILEKDYRGLRLEIGSDCKGSISDYAYAMEDSSGGILKKRVTDPQTGIQYEKHGHFVDALSYFICEAFIADFNYYLSGGNKPQYEVGNDREYTFNR